MALFFLYDCPCGEKYDIYMPYTMFFREAQKHGNSGDLSSSIAEAEKIDQSKQTQQELRLFKTIARFRSPVFIRAGVREVIQCRCGRVLDLIKIISGWTGGKNESARTI